MGSCAEIGGRGAGDAGDAAIKSGRLDQALLVLAVLIANR